jgi:indole-3-pyruvate monooxygenase
MYLNAAAVSSFVHTSRLLFFYMAQDDKRMLNDDGLPEKGYPNHWKGENGLYCAGFSRRGLAGISMDAKNIANDIAGNFLSG